MYVSCCAFTLMGDIKHLPGGHGVLVHKCFSNNFVRSTFVHVFLTLNLGANLVFLANTINLNSLIRVINTSYVSANLYTWVDQILFQTFFHIYPILSTLFFFFISLWKYFPPLDRTHFFLFLWKDSYYSVLSYIFYFFTLLSCNPCETYPYFFAFNCWCGRSVRVVQSVILRLPWDFLLRYFESGFLKASYLQYG